MTSTMIHQIPEYIRSSNSSLPMASLINPTSPGYPFYHTYSRSVLPFISDKHLSLLVPVLFYWVYSLVFHFLDTMQFEYFEKRRIHESPEVLSRNKATFREVLVEVLKQHTIQTIIGYLWFDNEEVIYRKEVMVDHMGAIVRLAPKVSKAVLLLLGPRSGEALLKSHGERLVQIVYWWGLPGLQLLGALLILDTWQYFWHRAFHTSKFLYRHIHSIHHRLYVPFAFGALYNHPLEGILFDTVGAGVAALLAGMSVRQATVFFGISSLKTVDDHAGYRIWWDPCQLLFANTSDYHDIHHQSYGIKANFSQPYFIQWDVLLGTRMTRTEADAKTRRPNKLADPPSASKTEKVE